VRSPGRRRGGTIGALDSRLLRPRHVQLQTASDDQHRYRYDSYRFLWTSFRL
jgi:hypothetical protein